MSLPEKTNPAFLSWLAAQPAATKSAVDEKWGATAADDRLFPGHRSAEYARLAYLIQFCRDTYGYGG